MQFLSRLWRITNEINQLIKDRSKAAGASIYDDAGEYVPKREKDEKRAERERDGGEKKRDYFGDGRKVRGC